MAISIPGIIVIIYYVFIAILILSILLDNRNPAKTAAYILILVFIPVFGVLVYTFFGQDYKKRKLFNLKGFKDNLIIQHWKDQHEQQILPHNGDNQDTVFQLLTSGNSILTVNNRTTILRNGEEKFPELFEVLSGAKHHIHLEYYIIDNDALTHQMGEILKKKVKDGIHVRIVFDDVGSRTLSNKIINDWENHGIEIKPYMKVRFPYLTSKANYRDHRKIAVIDGKTGFLGGINISGRYVNDPDQPQTWRDTHLKLEGECVRQLQLQFMLMWKFVAEETLPISVSYFPGLPTYKDLPTQIVVSGPDSDHPNIMLSFFKHIASAQHSVYITTPYFIPNDEILTAIISASLSGVDVKLIIPKISDSIIVQAAGMSYLRELLEAGVRVFLYTQGFIHAKTMVIDDKVSSVGTANMDVRSFDINFEINAFIYDTNVSKELVSHFNKDLEDSEELFLKRWERRPLTKKLIESSARLLAPLL